MHDQRLLFHYVQQGSEAAFSRLVRRYRPFVLRLCVRRLGDESLAEEATQTVFLALARRAASLQEHPAVAGWLAEAARRVASDLIRRRSHRQARERILEDGWLRIALWGGPPPSAVGETARARLHAALAALGPAEQTALLLRFDSEDSFPEIGAALGISEDAARMRVNRGLMKLRRRLLQTDAQHSTQRKAISPMNGQTTFAEAATLLHQQITQAGRAEFLPLVSEERLLEGIRVGRAAYPGTISAEGDAYLETVIDPMLQSLLTGRAWPENAEFGPFYSLKDERGVVHPGLGLTLEFRTPGAAYPGFSLSVLDVWYGAWS